MKQVTRAAFAACAGILLTVSTASIAPTIATTPEAPGESTTMLGDRVSLFDYDGSAPLQVESIGTETRDGVKIQDITFVPIPGQAPVKAYIVSPSEEGVYPGILWVHWLGEEHANRTQYLDEAVALAARGTVSLLIDAMWSAEGWYETRNPDEDRQNSINQVIALRRSLDLLTRLPQVDIANLAYVGHDYGAMHGMVMAGVDQRVRTYVFIAATQSFSDWAFFARQPASRAEWLRGIADIELLDYLSQVKNASVLFQFAQNDVYVSGATQFVLFNTAGTQDKDRKVYPDADHSMAVPEAAADRAAWLTEKFGLTGQ
jgi:cephalosporin-C deacetylase-like acetyl esterase